MLGLGPKTWTRALAKSSDQNLSQYRVLRPHWRDRKADDLIQNCAAVYHMPGTHTVYRGIENRCTRKWRITHLTRRLKKKHFISGNLVQIWTFWPSLGYTCIGSILYVAIKMSWARNFRAINFWTRALRSEAPATKSKCRQFQFGH